MTTIPLHSVTIMLHQPSFSSMSAFPQHEWIKPSAIRQELVGEQFMQWRIDDILFEEIRRRMTTKLRLGQRVIIDGTALERAQRLKLTTAAYQMGVPVFYAVEGSHDDPNVSRGDGMAELINTLHHPVDVVAVPPPMDPYEQLKSRWSGITVLGDVHGMFNAMQTAIAWARSRNHFLLFVGDVLDYGASTLEVGDEVYRLVMRGEAELVVGNHERKIMRWADGQRVRLSHGNRVTTSALAGLGDTAKSRWLGRFRGLYSLSRYYRTIGNVTFAHGAVHPALWEGDSADREVEDAAFFGEIDTRASKPDKPVRSYRWVDSIPEGKTVVVGHDIRATVKPLVQPNAQGGAAVFLDTGSGKGGHLSTADFRFTENGLQLLNFNIH